MKAAYEFEFESDAQRESLEAALQRMGIAYRKLPSSDVVQEPEAEYRTAPELSPEDQRRLAHEIELGLADADAGRVVPVERVEARLVALQKRLKNG